MVTLIDSWPLDNNDIDRCLSPDWELHANWPEPTQTHRQTHRRQRLLDDESTCCLSPITHLWALMAPKQHKQQLSILSLISVYRSLILSLSRRLTIASLSLLLLFRFNTSIWRFDRPTFGHWPATIAQLSPLCALVSDGQWWCIATNNETQKKLLLIFQRVTRDAPIIE